MFSPLKTFSLIGLTTFVSLMMLLLAGCAGSKTSRGGFGLAGIDPILARQYVTNTVHIPGGNYPVPYNISTPNTEYILDGDISADGTAISINASKVVVNLNGHTITYNQTVPGEGVRSGSYNRSDIAIINGSIIQGAAMSEGGLYGDGINPIKTSGYIVARLQVANIYARIGGRDVAAFIMGGTAPLIENNTIEDTYDYGTLKDRHSGISILRTSGEYAIVRNNTIINCRHRGIEVTNYAEVYGNNISIRSIATNAAGISGWAVHDVKVHDNTITGRGEHPIGIGFSGPPTTNIEIYNNVIDVEVTRLGCEYGGNLSDCTQHVGTCWSSGKPCVTDRSTGIRAHKEGHNVYVHDNYVTVRTDSAYLGHYSADGTQVLLSTKGRGIQVGNPVGGSALYEHNTVVALDKDGTGEIGGLVCDTNYEGSNLVLRGNTVTSNVAPLVLGDGYGWCSGHPLFIQNTFLKSTEYAVTPNHPENFHTISSGAGGFYEGTGTLISNIYLNGASESDLNMHFDNLTGRSSVKNKSIVFGRIMEVMVKDLSGTPLPNIRVRTYDQSNRLQTETVTDAKGMANFMLYDYKLNNKGGTTGNTTPIKVTFRPHKIELYDQASSQVLFTTKLDNSDNAWDSVTSNGIYTLSDVSGSITINTIAGKIRWPER